MDPPEFHWSAPPECPAVAEVLAQVDRLVQRPRADSLANTQVTAEVTRDSDGVGPYRLRLVITDRQGKVRERRIEGETCAQVADAAALVVALSSDSEAAPPAAPPVAAPAADQPSPPSPGEATDEESSPPDLLPPPAPISWELTGSGGIDFASLPAPTPGVVLAVSMGSAKNRLDLRGAYYLPQAEALGVGSRTGVNVSLYAGALRYRRLLLEGDFDLAACAGVEAGILLASGIGLGASPGGDAPWVAPALGFVGAFNLTSGVALALELEGLVPLVRPRFVVDLTGQVFQPPWFTVRTLAGLRIRFP